MRKVVITKNMPEHEAKRKLRALSQRKNKPKNGLSDLVQWLKRFERKFGMSTVEFYEKFRRGKMGDDSEMLQWAGLYEAYVVLVQDQINLKLNGQ